jgi:membrane fusion protein, multidrug efflux system
MKFKNILLSLLILFLMFNLNSCGNKPVEELPVEDQTKEPGTIENKQKIPVEALIVKLKKLEQNIPLTGILKPLHEVDIIAEVSGKAEVINKKLGDAVTTKDTLAIIDEKIPLSNYRQAKSQVLTADNNLKIAKLNFKSDEELFKNGDISELAYENSRLAVKSAEASRLSALANLSLLEKNYRDTRITSPIAGLIARKNIDIGTMVTPNLPVYRVVDLTILKIRVGVPQSMINRVQVGSEAKVQISALNNQVFGGEVRYISPQTDESTGAFTIEAHVQNTKNLKIRAGMTAKVDLILKDKDEKLIIPDHALISKNGNNHLYKIIDGIARLTEVTIGETIGSQVIVSEGLAEGDTIVVVGMKNLGIDTNVWIETIH